MKKQLFLLTAMFLGLLGCTETPIENVEKEESYTISASPSKIIIKQSALDKSTFTIKTDDPEWTYTSSSSDGISWAVIEQDRENNKLTVNAKTANDTEEARTTTIIVSTADGLSSAEITYTQEGPAAEPEPEPDATPTGTAKVVDVYSNFYITEPGEGTRNPWIGGEYVYSWTNPTSVISTYVYFHEKGNFYLSLNISGKSEIKVTAGETSHIATVNSISTEEAMAGSFPVDKPGYMKIDFQGVTSNDIMSGSFGQLKGINIYGNTNITYVHDFDGYWGRRGPSVHMKYELPGGSTEWFYNEVTVPEEGEVMSSYYMAAGFGEGYFGMQYNSAAERRILFSVWAPYETDDPNDIPEELRVSKQRQGEGVYIGEFGNEGSGGQSYLVYPWKAGETYKFLMHVEPDDANNTTYTAYFRAPEEDTWRLIASFKRPITSTWYTNAHSFLENFNPDQGYLERSVNFSNQWACSTSGVWTSLSKGTFTHDGTASAGVRLDYQGGLNTEGSFYLKMGGFFNQYTRGYTNFTSTYKGEQPDIDFEALKNIPDGE